MKIYPAGNFKAKCLALIDQVYQNHEAIIITKYGKPLVKVVPINTSKDSGQKPLKDTATYIGDIISPIDDKWEAEQ